jgi:hypothetical protein
MAHSHEAQSSFKIEVRVPIPRNSCGFEWGKAGYGFMPFAYLEKLADDFWTIRK